MEYQPVAYKYTSTKEYIQEFPCAYRQWRADDRPGPIPSCRRLHGYSFSFKFYFGTNNLDARNWVADYGSLRPLKEFLQSQFDHTTICAADDPNLDWFKEADRLGIMKLIILPSIGCESLADQLYKYVNGVFIPEEWGTGESERIWCYRVEVRETDVNMAFREGHRSWHKPDLSDLLE